MIQVKVIGQMDKDNENSFESTNRVYSTKGLSPTLNTCGGGGREPKFLVKVRCNVIHKSKASNQKRMDQL